MNIDDCVGRVRRGVYGDVEVEGLEGCGGGGVRDVEVGFESRV